MISKNLLIISILSLILISTVSSISLSEGFSEDQVVTSSDNDSRSDLGTAVPQNGTFILELNITEVESEKDKVDLLKFELNESYQNRRSTGGFYRTHTVKGLTGQNKTLYNKSFGLYSRSVVEPIFRNGEIIRPNQTHTRDRYPKHVFEFPADYRIEKLIIEENDKTIFELNIPERICVGENPPHYCQWNNYTETSDNGNITGVFEPQDKETVSLGFWEKIIALISGWIQNII